MKFIAFLSVLTLLIACSGTDSFQKEGLSLKGYPLKLENELIRSAGNILISNDYVFLYDLQSENNLVTVFHKSPFSLHTTFGVVGEGPNQVKRPGFCSLDRQNKRFFICDAGSGSILSYHIDDLGSQPVRYSYPSDLILLTDFFHEQNNIFVAKPFDIEISALARFAANKDSVTHFGNILDTGDPLVFTDYYNQYMYSIGKHPTKKQFIRAYRHYDIIQILNEKGDVIHSFRGPLNISYKKERELLATYRRIRTTEKYIYCEFVGRNVIDESSHSVNFADKIHVFDWDLNPVAKLNLDRPIISFDLDLENNRIISYTENEEEPLWYFTFDESSLN